MRVQEGVATPADVRGELLRASGRGYGTVRHLLVQQPRGSAARPSRLADLVRQRKHRALVLYLLLLTAWPFLKKRPTSLPGAVWARALTSSRGVVWTPTDVSDAWKDLEQLSLIERQRVGRAVMIWPRREDGQANYTAPGGAKANREETFFILPGAFWTEEHFAHLSLPGLALLLIVLAETSKKKECWLTYDHVEAWYGLSASTMQKAVRELEREKILQRRSQRIKAPLSPTGYTTRWWYSLTGPYSTDARQRAQGVARRAARRRVEANSGSSTATSRTQKRRPAV